MRTLVVLSTLVACTSPTTGPPLKPGTARVYERPLKFGDEQESIGITDLARDEDTVVMMLAYGYKTFFNHPDYTGSSSARPGMPIDGPPANTTGSSGSSGSYLIAVSRDGGASFETRWLLASTGVSGEPMGVHFHDGRAWLLLYRAPPGLSSARAFFVHPLDLDTGTVGEVLPDQRFSILGGSIAASGSEIRLALSVTGDVDRLDGYFGVQTLDLATGTFTDGVTMVRFDGCAHALYSADTGQTWEGYGPCNEMMCRLSTTVSGGVPARDCVPRVAWPGPFEAPFDDIRLIETPAGVVAVHVRDGKAFAARIRGGAIDEISLGAAPLFLAGRPDRRLRLPFGELIALDDRLISLSSAGVASSVPLPKTPCTDDARCPGIKGAHPRVRTLALGGDSYLAVYAVDTGVNEIVGTIYVRKETAIGTPLEEAPAIPSPVPACPWAIPASPLVKACARAASCLPALDIRTCLNDWSVLGYGPTPAALARFVAVGDCAELQSAYPAAARRHATTCTVGCAGDTAVQRCSTSGGTHEAVDCALRGTTCNDSVRGVGCYDASPAVCGTCDERGRAVECAGVTPMVTDCGAFAQVCAVTPNGPRCVAPLCSTLGNASACVDGQVVSCNGVRACDQLGIACTANGPGTQAHCVRANGPGCTGTMAGCSSYCAGQGCATGWGCPNQGCSGDHMLVDLGDERAWLDCTKIGYRTCAEPFAQRPVCVM